MVNKAKERVNAVIREVAEEKGVNILALEIKPDHLHLSVSCYPQLAVHKLIKAFKGRSFYYLRREFPHLLKLPSLWTNSYFVSTASNVSNKTLPAYIQAQSRT